MDPRQENRQKLMKEMRQHTYLDAHKIAATRAELDISFLEEVDTLVRATCESIVGALAALESEVKRAREATDSSSRAILRWTGMLVVATWALVAATIALVWATRQLAK